MTKSIETYKQAIKQRVDKPRYKHSKSVAKTALQLAQTYDGIDEQNAVIAGYLHDWDKERHIDDLVAHAQELGFPDADLKIAAPILHSITGADSVRQVFSELDDEVFDAIRAHTLGAAPASPLTMALYIADMVEPLRNNPEAERLRGLIGKISLEDLYIECIQSSLAYLIEKKRGIHMLSIKIWNTLVR